MGGWVSGYVWYFVELSREPKHVAQQMRYQNVDLSNGYCLGTIINFELKSRDLLCACAVYIWLYLQYYWANLLKVALWDLLPCLEYSASV